MLTVKVVRSALGHTILTNKNANAPIMLRLIPNLTHIELPACFKHVPENKLTKAKTATTKA